LQKQLPSIQDRFETHKEKGKEMIALRKWFPALALLSLSVGTAFGQAVTCQANAGVPPLVRAEGYSELVGEVVLICTGGPTGQTVTTNIQVFLNTNITSRGISGSSPGSTTEALLLVSASGTPPLAEVSSPSAVVPCEQQTGNTCTGAPTPPFPPQPYIVRGRKAPVGENSIIFPNVQFTAPGTTTPGNQVILRIVNIRADASQLGVSTTLLPTQIVMFIAANPPGTVAINNPQQTVAFTAQGLQFGVRAADGTSTISSTTGVSLSQCVSTNGSLFSGSSTSGAATFSVRFAEGFAGAFKSANSEVGNFFLTNGTGGQATQGTRLVARFTNVPAGTRIFVSAVPLLSTTGGVSAQYVSGAGANGEGGSLTATGGFTVGTLPAQEVSIVGGTGIAVWEVVPGLGPSEGLTVLDTLVFSVAVAYSPNLGATPPLPGTGTSTVAGGFAPFYARSDSRLPDRISQTLPIPRFIDTATTVPDFTISACATSLLFPYVTNRSGYETGIVISNTSRDPLPGNSGRLQSGRCTINYFASSLGGTAPAPQTTTNPIAAGDQLVFLLGGGGVSDPGIAGAPGFQGYIIAVCGFNYAHGFAFITNGVVAEGYLPLVLNTDLPGNRVTGAVEALNN
jgi:hypothetical protein